MIPNWNWTLNSQKYIIYISTLYTLNTYPSGPNFGPFRSTSRFRNTRSSKIGNASKTPKLNFEQSLVTVKNTLYTLNTYPWGVPNFGPFRHMTCRFQDTGSPKIRMHRISPNWTWNLIQKYSVCNKYLPPEAQMLVRFALRPAVFKIQGRRKLEMHQMIPNWTWNT